MSPPFLSCCCCSLRRRGDHGDDNDKEAPYYALFCSQSAMQVSRLGFFLVDVTRTACAAWLPCCGVCFGAAPKSYSPVDSSPERQEQELLVETAAIATPWDYKEDDDLELQKQQQHQEGQETYHCDYHNNIAWESKHDPYKIVERFVDPHWNYYATALSEIRAGQKQSHWSWFIFPTPPYYEYHNGQWIEAGSFLNRYYALRTDQEAIAFLTFPPTNGVNLRTNYMLVMQAVTAQLENNPALTVEHLVGILDAPKLGSSLAYFEYVSRAVLEPPDAALNAVCRRAIAAVHDKRGDELHGRGRGHQSTLESSFRHRTVAPSHSSPNWVKRLS